MVASSIWTCSRIMRRSRCSAASSGAARTAAEPDATAELLLACAGLPLAIRISAARLASRSTWTIRSLADRLCDEHRRLDELKVGDLAVRASFEVSFASLPAAATPGGIGPARVFSMLGLWQGPSIGLSAAAALLGEDEAKVADALEFLVDAHLLESTAPDCYQFHDLLRVYAAETSLGRGTAGGQARRPRADRGLVPAYRQRRKRCRRPPAGQCATRTAAARLYAAGLQGCPRRTGLVQRRSGRTSSPPPGRPPVKGCMTWPGNCQWRYSGALTRSVTERNGWLLISSR